MAGNDVCVPLRDHAMRLWWWPNVEVPTHFRTELAAMVGVVVVGASRAEPDRRVPPVMLGISIETHLLYYGVLEITQIDGNFNPANDRFLLLLPRTISKFTCKSGMQTSTYLIYAAATGHKSLYMIVGE